MLPRVLPVSLCSPPPANICIPKLLFAIVINAAVPILGVGKTGFVCYADDKKIRYIQSRSFEAVRLTLCLHWLCWLESYGEYV